MKIGVLGTGFGIVHLQTFANHPLVDELVFFSRTQQKADELSAQMGVRGTTSIDDILCDPTVEVVTIALPHRLHAEVAIRAMEQGKHVICEVPVCPTTEEAERVAAVSQKTGRRVLVDLFSRFTPAHRFLQDKISSGEYGRLLTSPDGVPVQMTTSTLMPLSYGVQERIEASFEHSAVVYNETSWSRSGNASELVVYDQEQRRVLPLREANHYYDSLTYCLERILDGKPGITDLSQAIPGLKLALELLVLYEEYNRQLPF